MTTDFKFPKVEKYNTPKFTNPDDEYKRDGTPRDPKQKVNDPEYYLEKARYLYSAFLTDNFSLGYSASLEYAINRSYSSGNQSNVKYMDILTPKNEQGQRKAFANFSWDNLAVYTKFRDIAVNRLRKFDYKTDVESIEDDDILEKERMKMLAFVKQQEKEFIDTLRQTTGMPEEQAPQEQLPIEPQSLKELDMLQGLGCFSLPLEISLQKKITKT